MTSQPNGIILVTGPTGSGKTTTLYSTLKHLATPEVNVCTLEDPIEMVEPSFNQMQVQTGIDLTFADGVRALMRQDPDIIMVGEIRDLETADMAIQAALTGHLVLSTLHTNDAPSAITRLLDLGVPYYLINSTVLGIMAQRLVRTLCPHCKQPIPMPESDNDVWDHLVAPWKAARPAQLQNPRRLPGMSHDRLHRTYRYLRDTAHVTRTAQDHPSRDRHCRAARPSQPRRHETAAHLGCAKSRCRTHHLGRSTEGCTTR